MNDHSPLAAWTAKDWLTPPVLVPLFLVIGLGLWIAIRPYLG